MGKEPQSWHICCYALLAVLFLPMKYSAGGRDSPAVAVLLRLVSVLRRIGIPGPTRQRRPGDAGPGMSTLPPSRSPGPSRAPQAGANGRWLMLVRAVTDEPGVSIIGDREPGPGGVKNENAGLPVAFETVTRRPGRPWPRAIRSEVSFQSVIGQ